MKKILFILIALISISLIFAIDFSGVNEAEFIKKDTDIDDSSYFSDNIQLQFYSGSFSSGLKYELYRPYYDKYATGEVAGDDIERLSELFVQYEASAFTLRAGTYEAIIGNGMTLHTYYDSEFDEDSSLLGGFLSANINNLSVKGFLGKKLADVEMETQYSRYLYNDIDFEYDNVLGFDAEILLNDYLTLGGAFVFQDAFVLGSEERTVRNIFNGRANIIYGNIDFSTEYSFGKDDEFEGEEDLERTAFYSTASYYADAFTLTGSYKNYSDFNIDIADLPTANNADEQLHEHLALGEDEEGLMGQIQFAPYEGGDMIVNYAEGWSSNQKVRMANFYGEYTHHFDGLTLIADCEILEQMDKRTGMNWVKETTPQLKFDFMMSDYATVVKTEFQKVATKYGSVEADHFEPKFQADVDFNLFGISAIIEHQYGDDTHEDDGETWLGAELKTTVLHSTEITLFYGKEKGGKVCRNGICKEMPPFEGLRIDISTSF